MDDAAPPDTHTAINAPQSRPPAARTRDDKGRASIHAQRARGHTRAHAHTTYVGRAAHMISRKVRWASVAFWKASKIFFMAMTFLLFLSTPLNTTA